MRDIKFRVWNGIEMVYDVMVGKFGVFYVNPSNNGIDEKDAASLTPYNTKCSNDIPLMQYSGIKDIYEGDIVCVNEKVIDTIQKWNAEVCFKEGMFCLVNRNCCETCKDGFGMICPLNEAIYFGTVEVIGNIYQNLDLLNE